MAGHKKSLIIGRVLQYHSGAMKKRAESREGMVITTVALEKDLHRRLAIAAIDESAAITEIVRQAVSEWLDQREPRRSRKGA